MKNKVKQRRKELEISQSELASKLGITVGWLSKIENNQVDLKMSLALRITKHLDCRLDDIFLED